MNKRQQEVVERMNITTVKEDSKGNKPTCLSCIHCPCEDLIEAVEVFEAPSIAVAGACDRWQELPGVMDE